MGAFISCILPTKDRPGFLAQAIRCFLRQSYPDRELIIVDDGFESSENIVTPDKRITYLRLSAPTSLGKKLNLGINNAQGGIIQKLDDDDYYHPEFLDTTIEALMEMNSSQAVAAFDSFLVLLTDTGELKYSGKGWAAGGTLCFYRSMWEHHNFRDITAGEDWFFLKDAEPEQIKVTNPELYILVRHNYGHTWNRMGEEDVTDWFRKQITYNKTLKECIPFDEDRLFYEQLRVRRS